MIAPHSNARLTLQSSTLIQCEISTTMNGSAKLMVHRIVLLFFIPAIQSQCPTSASGLCFVDCTNPTLYHIACEGISGADLHIDLTTFSDVDQTLTLSVWHSPLARIGYAILRAAQLTTLELDNLLELQWFPEVRGQRILRELIIMNSPKVKKMPLELLPAKIERIVLHRVGITDFTNDIEEVPHLPLQFLSIITCRIQYIQPFYLHAFPSLTEIDIIGSDFITHDIRHFMFSTSSELRKFRIHSSPSSEVVGGRRRERLMEDVVKNTKMLLDGELDLSNNDLPISQYAVDKFDRLRFLRKILLQGNNFVPYVLFTRTFAQFDRLEELDLSFTDFPKSTGSFAGLKSLRYLKIAGNHLRDLTTLNIFKDCQATELEYLDLANNDLEYLPVGSESISNLKELNLRKNNLNMQVISDNDYLKQEHVVPFRVFTQLRKLDISENNLETFNGMWLKDLHFLTHLNIALNNFQYINRTFFEYLPKSLQVLNLTFSVKEPKKAPHFELSAFAKLPPLKTLILAGGLLRNGFFHTLKSVSIRSLKELDLSYNSLSHIPEEVKFLRFSSTLHTLKLRGNKLQSIGPNAFASFTRLKELDISRNNIISIGQDDFVGLDHLKTLAIAGNTILEFETGAFAPLVHLQQLYMGENNDTDLTKVFPLYSNIGKNLIHLGIPESPIQCIPAELILQLKKLRWLYLNASRAVNFQFSSFRGFTEQFTIRHPFKLYAFRIPTVEDLGCESYDEWNVVYNRSAKFVVKDKADQVLQHMIINFPTCHMEKRRNMKELIENLIC